MGPEFGRGHNDSSTVNGLQLSLQILRGQERENHNPELNLLKSSGRNDYVLWYVALELCALLFDQLYINLSVCTYFFS